MYGRGDENVVGREPMSIGRNSSLIAEKKSAHLSAACKSDDPGGHKDLTSKLGSLSTLLRGFVKEANRFPRPPFSAAFST